MAMPTSDAWSGRIEREFAQCPALRLTAGQAARLWGLDSALVERIFAGLVARHLLFQTDDGRYVRRGACPRCE